MTNLSQGVKDFTAGLCSGWAQVIIMQPFDIIKIRLQTQDLANPRYHGIVDCLKKIVHNEGIMALYKGSPMIHVRHTIAPDRLRLPGQHPVRSERAS